MVIWVCDLLSLCSDLIHIIDLSGGRDLPSYFAREDERGTHLVVKDSDTIGASYDHYIHGMQHSLYADIESVRPMTMGLGARLHEDPRLMGIGLGGADHIVAATSKGRDAGLLSEA